MPRRPRNIPPLLKVVKNGDDMRDLREAEPKQEGSVLPSSHEGEVTRDEPIGVFGPGATAEAQPVIQTGRRDADSLDANLTALLKQILREEAGTSFQDDPSRRITNLEVLARRMVADALTGDRTMREMVVERVEGKAVRAAQVTPPDTTLEDQLDQAAIAALNDLATKKE